MSLNGVAGHVEGRGNIEVIQQRKYSRQAARNPNRASLKVDKRSLYSSPSPSQAVSPSTSNVMATATCALAGQVGADASPFTPSSYSSRTCRLLDRPWLDIARAAEPLQPTNVLEGVGWQRQPLDGIDIHSIVREHSVAEELANSLADVRRGIWNRTINKTLTRLGQSLDTPFAATCSPTTGHHCRSDGHRWIRTKRPPRNAAGWIQPSVWRFVCSSLSR